MLVMDVSINISIYHNISVYQRECAFLFVEEKHSLIYSFFCKAVVISQIKWH